MKRTPFFTAVAAHLLLSLGLLAGACSSAPAAGQAESQEPGPAELWAWNCGRCHGIQPAARYSDAEWKIVMHHMRLQCYLTGEEQRAIEQLLRSTNN